MTTLATAIRYNPEAKKNAAIHNLTGEYRTQDNAAFLARVAKELDALAAGPQGAWFDRGGARCIGLMGEYGLVGSTLRQAQAFIRLDRTPSYWSHAFLIHGGLSPHESTNRSPLDSAWIWESTLEPASPFNHFIERDGVGARRLADYNRAEFDVLADHCVPNIAVLAIGLTDRERDEVRERANDPNVDQLSYDLSALLGEWYRYLTESAVRTNPLASGKPLYSSAYLQLAFDAVGIDLAPGAHQKNISPEHIWQLARYLYGELRTVSETGEAVQRPVHGWYCARQPAAVLYPPELEEEKDKIFPCSLEDAMELIKKRARQRSRALAETST